MRDTPLQSALPWNERRKNVRNAFSCDRNLLGKRVALVDDVLTTGASMNALADAVQKRGASEIRAWVVARTLSHNTNGPTRSFDLTQEYALLRKALSTNEGEPW